MERYNWQEITKLMQKFAYVEDINDIIILGVLGGVQRIMVNEDD